ncbi:exported hypothetical protein [Candidatus Accumulibacter aalborgensis]|uniref:PEP-CTERM protein-sorting domain-containing protein n=1 Tax=Candidatus Accumulibacter aalborgensis TaxID=1860102 RepID=A0A1A8XLX5_9PROT|nr:PEP-CTERM sorting domain-containing protein [Candidatus Accumulibacter aalborgensis]SBT05676.1 exported hypothetical protein [Candidatus Accumulibacter aalborgensis]
MKISKTIAPLALAVALLSGSAGVFAYEDLTTWNTSLGTNGSASVASNFATLTGTALLDKSFNLAAGYKFEFDWLFVAGDELPYNDWATVFVGNNLSTTLSDVATVGDFGVSGWKHFVTTLANSVNGQIAFSVNNLLDDDPLYASSLSVTNVLLSSPNVPVPVPEPGMLLVTATGLGLLAFIRRRKQISAV